MDNLLQPVSELSVSDKARAKEVRINHMGMIGAASMERYLFTECVNSCTGLAVLSKDGTMAAMVHLNSSQDHYRYGEDAVRHHAQSAWAKFEDSLEGHADLTAVAFGGRNHIPAEYADGETAHQVTSASRWLGDAFFESAKASGRIGDITDLRYSNVATDAAIDLHEGKIILDEYGGELAAKLKARCAENPGKGKTYFDHSNPASILHRGWDIG